MYIAVVKYNSENRIIKLQDFEVEQAAIDFVDGLDVNDFPDAFVDETPQGGLRDWVVDPVTETLSYDPIVDVISPLITFEEFENRFTTQEWNAATDYSFNAPPATKRKINQAIQRATAKNSVDLSHSKTSSFLGLLVTGGVISAPRKIEILTP